MNDKNIVAMHIIESYWKLDDALDHLNHTYITDHEYSNRLHDLWEDLWDQQRILYELIEEMDKDENWPNMKPVV